MTNKFTKPEFNPLLSPVDYYNIYVSWDEVLDISKTFTKESDTWYFAGKEMNLGALSWTVTKSFGGYLAGESYSKFMILTKEKFKGDYRHAMTYVDMRLLNKHLDYLRIGCDFYKKIEKEDRYGIKRVRLKAWRSTEITRDHGKIFSSIPRFNDFTIVPDNKDHRQTIGQYYNLYAPFNHKAADEYDNNNLKYTLKLLNHIFGDQIDLGLKYMKLLYENPTQILPVLCLVSRERETGKTTFLNWISVLFGDNYILVNPEEIGGQFNSGYASKNIIGIDETVIEKKEVVEKIKSLSTAKEISVNEKHVSNYKLPFFAKIILATNKESDFMRIDKEEIRFWVRRVPRIRSEKESDFENKLISEIPEFLCMLESMPEVDVKRSRMAFTAEELYNDELQLVKKESRSWLCKDMEIMVRDLFDEFDRIDEFEATPKDIFEQWFHSNGRVNLSYIAKVLKDEIELEPSEKSKRYLPFEGVYMGQNEIKKVGSPYKFKREDWGNDKEDVEYEGITEEKLPF